MTLIAWLLIIGATCTLFAGCLWCIIRVGDSTHTNAPRPTLDALSLYIMEREVKRIVDEEYDIMEREKEWRR